MLQLIELSVYGELFFFESKLTLSQYNHINKLAHNFFIKNQKPNIDLFITTVYNTLNIKLCQVKIHKVISI